MRRFAFALAVAVAFAAGQSGAATINIDGVGAAWGSVVANGSKSLVTGIGTSEVDWGKPVPAKGQKSGYGFVGLSSMGLDVNEEFELGTFTHFNNPIAVGTSIKETTLSLSVNLTIDGEEKNVGSAFRFLHNETPNLSRGKTCANKAKFGTGANKNGCADKVTFASVLELL